MSRAAAAVLLAALVAAAAPPAATAAPGFADLAGGGAPGAVNCTPSGALESSWLEISQLLNYTQYKSAKGADLSLMPDPVPFPWSLSAEDTRAPGFYATCISRSPSAAEDCTGDECNVFIEEWGISWLEFALLDCWATYPALGSTNFFSPQPAPGNISLIITEQCKNYYYSSESAFPFFYSVTDEWGHKWALQTSHQNLTTEAEWDAMVDQVVFPPGWKTEKVPLNETGQVHTPFLVGGRCIIPVFKDSSFNTWHAYTYPEDLSSGESLLNAVGDTCERLDAEYTASIMKQDAQQSADDGEASAPTPAPTNPASAALGRAPAVLLGALAAVAAGLLA